MVAGCCSYHYDVHRAGRSKMDTQKILIKTDRLPGGGRICDQSRYVVASGRPHPWLKRGRLGTVCFWGCPSGKLPFCVRPHCRRSECFCRRRNLPFVQFPPKWQGPKPDSDLLGLGHVGT